MTDDETTESTIAPPGETTAAAPGTAVALPHHHHSKKDYISEGFKNRTAGEAIFNLSTYAGIGYFGVTTATVLMTWLLRDSKLMSGHYSKLIEKVFETTRGNRTGKALEEHFKTVDSNMTIAAMFTGGSIMSVLPIKWMEDGKAHIVKWLDQHIYGKEKTRNDPTIRAAHEDLDSAPKQTWFSVITSRVLAFGATFGTSLFMGSNGSPFGRTTGHSIDRESIHAGRWIDGAIHHRNPEILKQIEQARRLSPHEIARNGPATDRVASNVFSYITLDAFYTAITSGTLYVFTRILAPFFDKKLNEREQAQTPEQLPPVFHEERKEVRNAMNPASTISNAEISGRLQETPEHAQAMA